MKKAIAMMMLLGGGLFAAPGVRFGIGIGAPAPVAVVRPVCPGPGYAWVGGYYAPDGVWVGGYYAPDGVWVGGYWAPPARVVRVGPRFYRARAFDGRFEHFRR